MKTTRKNYDAIADANSRQPKPKRLRTTVDVPEAKEETPSLPPEVWAIVMGCLPYSDVLSASAVSRTMLRDVMPRLEMLHIIKTSELHVAPTGRFRNVKDVNVYCLINRLTNVPLERLFSVDDDAAGRAVPFLCRFPRLERAFLGGLIRGGRGNKLNDVVGYNPDVTWSTGESDHYKTIRGLIVALSGAFRSGALQKVWIMGIRCPDSDPLSEGCPYCRQACRSFPIGQVVDFEHQGSSEPIYRSGDSMCSLDVCLPNDEIVEILKKRPGGLELLRSPKRFLDILGRGTRHVIVPDAGNTNFVVKYDEETIEELESCMAYGINPSALKKDDVVRAIMRSFADDDRDPVPPAEQCYLAESSFSMLLDLGLPVTKTDFTRNGVWRYY